MENSCPRMVIRLSRILQPDSAIAPVNRSGRAGSYLPITVRARNCIITVIRAGCGAHPELVQTLLSCHQQVGQVPYPSHYTEMDIFPLLLCGMGQVFPLNAGVRVKTREMYDKAHIFYSDPTCYRI